MAHLAKILFRHKSSILNSQKFLPSTKLGNSVSEIKSWTSVGGAWENWNNSVMNKVDHHRISVVGPDRGCAEWLLKCGAKVKWKGLSHWEKDYNLLPGGNFKNYKIEEIDATNSIIMNEGMVHLRGLKDVNKIIFHECKYFNDESIVYLTWIKKSLQHLQISKCEHVTAEGLNGLSAYKNLKTLKLFQLSKVKSPENCYKLLTKELPDCDIEYGEVTGSDQSTKQQNDG